MPRALGESPKVLPRTCSSFIYDFRLKVKLGPLRGPGAPRDPKGTPRQPAGPFGPLRATLEGFRAIWVPIGPPHSALGPPGAPVQRGLFMFEPLCNFPCRCPRKLLHELVCRCSKVYYTAAVYENLYEDSHVNVIIYPYNIV